MAGFGISFFRWDGISAMHFMGLDNYINLFKDTLFWKAMGNTLFIGIIAHIPILLGGLALAYILNSKLVKENVKRSNIRISNLIFLQSIKETSLFFHSIHNRSPFLSV